jgi:hypothetical protein
MKFIFKRASVTKLHLKTFEARWLMITMKTGCYSSFTFANSLYVYKQNCFVFDALKSASFVQPSWYELLLQSGNSVIQISAISLNYAFGQAKVRILRGWSVYAVRSMKSGKLYYLPC